MQKPVDKQVEDKVPLIEVIRRSLFLRFAQADDYFAAPRIERI